MEFEENEEAVSDKTKNDELAVNINSLVQSKESMTPKSFDLGEQEDLRLSLMSKSSSKRGSRKTQSRVSNIDTG
jgi:Tfp pilus assembly protein FimV